MGKRKRKGDAVSAADFSTCETASTVQYCNPGVNYGAFVKVPDYSTLNSSSAKWQSLEHAGVTFFPRYEPHGVPILFKNKPLKVSSELEEVCNWWANVEGSEFAEKDLVRKNFQESFLALVGKGKSLNDFDFSKVKEHLEQSRELRNARTTEEKKLETQQKQEAEKRFKFCQYNGKIEKVANHMVEPPGIFRGRGEHPHAGRIKSRIIPEFVTINIGLESPIPACSIPGHSWKRVTSN